MQHQGAWDRSVGGNEVANYYRGMVIEALAESEAASAAELWSKVGLTRPWNDPAADFRRAIEGPTSTVLGMKHEGELVGTVMVGHDGHRGWVYYLAVEPSLRHGSVASKLMTAAEEWLRNLGVVKVQLMVRIENEQAFGFFDKIGYEVNEVRVLSLWLTEVDSGPI